MAQAGNGPTRHCEEQSNPVSCLKVLADLHESLDILCHGCAGGSSVPRRINRYTNGISFHCCGDLRRPSCIEGQARMSPGAGRIRGTRHPYSTFIFRCGRRVTAARETKSWSVATRIMPFIQCAQAGGLFHRWDCIGPSHRNDSLWPPATACLSIGTHAPLPALAFLNYYNWPLPDHEDLAEKPRRGHNNEGPRGEAG